MGRRRGRGWAAVRWLVVLALVVPVVQGEVTGVAAPGGRSAVAAGAMPPVGVWGFDVVATVGTGSGGFGGDGGPAAAASMRQPGDVVASPDGATWYVADTWNDRIRAVDVASGVITTVAGSDGQCRRDIDPGDVCGDGGPATAATLNRPGGVALSGDGSVLYIADTDVNLVRAVTLASGVITTLAGTGSEGFGGDGGPATAAQLAGPSGVAAASDGSVYVADTLNNALRRVAPDGTISTSAGTGIGCVDPSTACGDGGPATAAQLSAPVGVSAGPAEAGIVVADTGNHRVRLIGADGVITTVAGTGLGGSSGDGGPATGAQLNEPTRAVVGPGGAVYIADTANHRIRVVVQGTIWAVAGTGSAASGPSGQPSWGTGLQRPDGLAVTSTGVVVADTANHVLRAMTVPHAVLSFTVCGPNPATPGGLTSAEIPLAGLPAPAFVTADVFGAAGGRAGAAVGGGGGYAHGTVRVDPADDRLLASVGCHGGDGGGAGGGGGGGASTVEVIDASGAGAPVLIAGGGGGAGTALAGCPAAGGHGWPGGHGVGSRGGAAVAVSGGNHGGGGEGGMQPGKVTVPSGTSGFGGPGGAGGGDGGGVGGWGRSPDPDPPGPAPAGAGGNGITANGHLHLPCLGTGGGGGGFGGGASGDTRVAGGSGGGSYGVCADPATAARSTGDGSIVVEITTSAPTSCTPPPPPAQPGPRDDAHARVWLAADTIGDTQALHATLPAPQAPRVPAASTVNVSSCPAMRIVDIELGNQGQPIHAGAGQVVINQQTVVDEGGDTDTLAYVIPVGLWAESPQGADPSDPAFCSILNNPFSPLPFAAPPLSVDLGPGTVLMWQMTGPGATGQPTIFYSDFQAPPLTATEAGSQTFTNGAVLLNVDALKAFNQCPGCDLSGTDLSGLTFPAATDLTGANLSGATISNTEFPQPKLTNATFGVEADGTAAVISDSSLDGANAAWTGFDKTIFKAVSFDQASFTCASFQDTVVLEASFDGATWSSPSCSGPTFDGTVLAMDTLPPPQWSTVSFDKSTIVVETATRAAATGITLPSWTFTNSQFVGVPPDLSGITVTGATLDGSSFVLANLTGATFNAPTSVQNAVFLDATLDTAKLPGAVGHGAVFTGASLEGAVFDEAQLGTGADPNNQLPQANFASVDAHGASFRNVEARQVQFDHAYLYPGDAAVSFTGATLEGATFSGAVLGQTDFTNIHGASVGFEGAQCVNCDFTGAAMADAHFDSAWVYGAVFKSATMTNASFNDAACCGSGTWTYSLGSGAAAPAELYQDITASLGGPEFDNVDLCPSGLPPTSSSGCEGKTVPQQPPPQPECSAAADHDCVLDIVLLAGDGTAGYSDGGIQQDAKLAAFNSPGDVAYDPNTGDALVADTNNGVVRRISQVSSSTPQISIVAGSPPVAGTPAVVQPPLKRTRPLPGAVRAVPTLIAPTGVATTTVGSVTTIGIADQKSHIVFATTGAGAPQPLAGTGLVCAAPTDACGDGDAASRAELNAPQGIWFDPTGNLYIADTGDNRIRKVDTTGVITTIAGTGQAGYTGDGGAASAAQLNGPTDVVGDQLGNLYVADAGNAAIRRIDPGGNITTLAGGDGSLINPTSITVDGRNRLYLTDAGANIVATLNVFGIARPAAGTGTAGYSGDGGPALSAQLNGPLGVAAVGDNTIYIADTTNQRIRTVQPASS